MQVLDSYPRQGCFAPGEPVRLSLTVQAGDAKRLNTRLLVTHLDQALPEASFSHDLQPGRNQFEITWQPPAPAYGGYGARLHIEAQGKTHTVCTAFDVLADWTAFPRYGFLCDFTPWREDCAATLERLLPFHINGLQFYDWQYRHDTLLPPGDEYTDPLGRQLSLRTVHALLEAAHARRMAALPYLAVYAASAAFWREHPGWALYDREGRAIPFGEDFLGLMDPSAGGPWAEHLLGECARVLAALPFDGLHIDQYGEPRSAWDATGRPVDLPAAFAAFIRAARERFPGKSALFNAVGNWPIETLAAAPTSFEYIEIWPPDTAYADLARILSEARRLSGGRPVTIAHYLPAARPANNLLAEALIFANGGGRIALGEGARLLSDPYFPKHEPLEGELYAELRRFYDYAVRYGAWIGAEASNPTDVSCQAPQGVWVYPRRADGWLALHLVNFSGLGPAPRWDQDHGAPQFLSGEGFSLELAARPRRVLWSSPEQPDLRSLEFEYTTGRLACRIPALRWWSTIVLEL